MLLLFIPVMHTPGVCYISRTDLFVIERDGRNECTSIGRDASARAYRTRHLLARRTNENAFTVLSFDVDDPNSLGREIKVHDAKRCIHNRSVVVVSM